MSLNNRNHKRSLISVTSRHTVGIIFYELERRPGVLNTSNESNRCSTQTTHISPRAFSVAIAFGRRFNSRCKLDTGVCDGFCSCSFEPDRPLLQLQLDQSLCVRHVRRIRLRSHIHLHCSTRVIEQVRSHTARLSWIRVKADSKALKWEAWSC